MAVSINILQVPADYSTELRRRPFFSSSIDFGDKIPTVFGEDLFFILTSIEFGGKILLIFGEDLFFSLVFNRIVRQHLNLKQNFHQISSALRIRERVTNGQGCKKRPHMQNFTIYVLTTTAKKLLDKFFKYFFSVFNQKQQQCCRLEVIAKQCDCRYIAGVYSSEFTIKAAQNLGYKLLDEVVHNQYVDSLTGDKPFGKMISHNFSKAMYFDVDREKVSS